MSARAAITNADAAALSALLLAPAPCAIVLAQMLDASVTCAEVRIHLLRKRGLITPVGEPLRVTAEGRAALQERIKAGWRPPAFETPSPGANLTPLSRRALLAVRPDADDFVAPDDAALEGTGLTPAAFRRALHQLRQCGLTAPSSRHFPAGLQPPPGFFKGSSNAP